MKEYLKKSLNKMSKKLFFGKEKQKSLDKSMIKKYAKRFEKCSFKKQEKTGGWEKECRKIQKMFKEDNPKEFLQWEPVKRRFFVENSWYSVKELVYLLLDKDWKRWSTLIKEDKIGRPTPHIFYPEASGNSIHQAYHIARFEDLSGRSINNFDLIFEFGGGYGRLCKMAYDSGFKGSYIIHDLEHVSILQEYYLKTIGIDVKSIENKNIKSGVYTSSSLEKMNKVDKISKKNKSLFVANWSLSETPLNLRNKILPKIRHFNNYLIAYQKEFEGVDNVVFFEKLQNKIDKKFIREEIEHIPDNYYLVGKS